jgi:DNA-binding GntR family transcriptional regulator
MHDASVGERIVRDVIDGLYEGRYEPGQRLTEAQMTVTYRVSRGPVREALNRLAAIGVIELIPQRGARVRDLTLHDAIDILLVAQGLVGIAARLAAERIDRAGAARLKAAYSRLSRFEASSNDAAYAVARDGFYSTVNSIAHNAQLERILPGVQIHLVRVQFRAVLRAVDRSRHRDYHAILSAIVASSAKAAEKAARAHIGRSIAALCAYGDRAQPV